MTTRRDPEDGTLVEREGVDAGSARSTGEGPLPSGGTTTGPPSDTAGGPQLQPTQVWAEGSGFADRDPDAAPYDESGQDEGLID